MFDTEVGIRRLACIAALVAGVALAHAAPERHYAGVTDDRQALAVVLTGGGRGSIRIQTTVALSCPGKGAPPAPLHVLIYRVPVSDSGAFRVRLLAVHPRLRRVVVSIAGKVRADRVDGAIAARGERARWCRSFVRFSSRLLVGQYG